MPLQQKSTAQTASGEQSSSAYVPGHWRALTRVGWGTLVILTLVIFFASLPVYVAQLQSPCVGSACWYTQLTPSQAEALQRIDLSPGVYAGYMVALTLATMAACVIVSTLIVWRRADDRMALVVALLLVALGPLGATGSVVAIPSSWRVPNEGLYFIALSLLVLAFLLFPSGQFVPQWMRWTLVVFLAWLVPTAFIVPSMPNSPLDQLTYVVTLGELATLAFVQVYRYQRVSSPLQRQQTKWVVFGIAVFVTVAVSGSALISLFPLRASPDSLYPLALNVAYFFLPLSILLIPLSFGFAMLRYRLWEIDRIINKALVYGLLTGLLGALYAGLIIGLESLAGWLTGQEEQPVVLVVSTLAIAALFLPVRRRLQVLIDRRFYRKKYDADQTLAAFSAMLRHQVDLEQIRAQVLSVVNETMQPTYVSLWISPLKPRAAEGGTGAAARSPAEEPASAERTDAV